MEGVGWHGADSVSFDVTVRHHTQEKYYAKVRKWQREDGGSKLLKTSWADLAEELFEIDEKDKMRTYKELIDQGKGLEPSNHFVPLVGSTFGRWSKKTVKFVEKLESKYLEKNGIEEKTGDSRARGSLRRRWLGRVAITNLKGNSLMRSAARMRAATGQPDHGVKAAGVDPKTLRAPMHW